MELHNPPPHSPEDTASSPAREWLERERRRSESATPRNDAVAAADEQESSDEKKSSDISFFVVMFVCLLASDYFIRDSALPFNSGFLLFPMVFGLLYLKRLYEKKFRKTSE